MIHHKKSPPSDSLPADIPDNPADHSPSNIKRTTSDEEDKGLITEELLTSPSNSEHEVKHEHHLSPTDLDADEEENATASRIPEAVAQIQLDDVLILKIENGRDYFLSVSAVFCPTAEGELISFAKTAAH